ncbi:MAG: DNA repair protein RecN [Oscillospiraceae bacterium]|nr:DNA repair protein RecN [Oscillospiraceae bacterium]
MLTSLKINDVAIIEEAVIEYDRGLNVMTGETGSGKSIVIDSINAALGRRTSRELIRSGADEARVTAVFENIGTNVIDALEEYGIDCKDGCIFIQRVIRDNRNICRINGEAVTVSVLKSVGDRLINIHGQNENQTLMNRENHLKYIDMLARNGELLRKYREKYDRLKAINKQLKKLKAVEAEKELRLDTLKYQIDEIESADIKSGEREDLIELRNKYQNFEKIQSALAFADNALNGNGEESGGALEEINTLINSLNTLGECINSANEYKIAVADCLAALQDCSAFISSELDAFGNSDIDINRIEERLDLIHRLSKKYGETEDDILTYLVKIKSEYEDIYLNSEKLEKLSTEYDSVLEELISAGNDLTGSRIKAGVDFSKKINEELRFLDMPNVDFKVRVDQCAATSTGLDDVEFLISANLGQEPKPIAKIASGGELSRIMLAIKCVLADLDKVDTLIFDEIDSGVSGRAAEKIGYKLKEVSKFSQVICVTHLAQIACFADNHLYIEKTTENGRTKTCVKRLDYNERKREIARIMGGSVITEATLKGAGELLERANNEIS